MATLRVTMSEPSIRLQPDRYLGRDNLPLMPGQVLDAVHDELGLMHLKRARIQMSLEASGPDNGLWNIELLVSLRGGFVHARPLEGGKQTTDFAEPLATLVALMTHPAAGGNADQLRVGRDRNNIKPNRVLVAAAYHRNSVLFLCPSGEGLLALFHEVKNYCPLTVEW